MGCVVVPQSMAYAKLALLPAQFGLYSSFMGVLIYWFFATSKDITIGVSNTKSHLSRLMLTLGSLSPSCQQSLVPLFHKSPRATQKFQATLLLQHLLSFVVLSSHSSGSSVAAG